MIRKQGLPSSAVAFNAYDTKDWHLIGLRWSYYAKQVGQSGVRAAENAYLSVQMAHGGAERVDVSVPCHLRPAVQRVVQRIPPLMKFDILEMTGAMTAHWWKGRGM